MWIRFDDPLASRHLIWARGLHDGAVTPHDRTCPGKDVAVLVGKLFCVALLGFDWRLKDQPRWNKNVFGLNVAAPEGPLTVQNFDTIELPRPYAS